MSPCSSGVSTFVADFLKRREEQMSRKGKGGKKGGGGSAGPSFQAPTAASLVAKGGPAAKGGVPGSEWQQPRLRQQRRPQRKVEAAAAAVLPKRPRA